VGVHRKGGAHNMRNNSELTRPPCGRSCGCDIEEHWTSAHTRLPVAGGGGSSGAAGAAGLNIKFKMHLVPGAPPYSF